jgi:hypothetical protein
MVTLNKPAAGDTDWTTEINDNWTSLEASVNGVLRLIKTVDESVTSSTTLQDDDELKFSIAAGETWQFEVFAFWGAASTSPDIKVALNGPGTPTLLRAQIQHYNGQGDAPYSGTVVTSYGVAESIDISSGPPNTLFVIKGTVVNGATAGTLVVQWAQRASSVTATTVKAGSYLVAHRI